MKAILLINMPSSCHECPLLGERWDECQAIGAIMSKEQMDTKPSWCPLRPMPKRSRPQDVGQVDDLYQAGLYAGWNECVFVLLGETE